MTIRNSVSIILNKIGKHEFTLVRAFDGNVGTINATFAKVIARSITIIIGGNLP